MRQLRNQVYLGNDEFVEEMQPRVGEDADLSEIPRVQKRKLADPITNYLDTAARRNEGIYLVYQSGGYTMKAISDELKLHYSTVSKIIKKYENSRFNT